MTKNKMTVINDKVGFTSSTSKLIDIILKAFNEMNKQMALEEKHYKKLKK